MNSVNSNIPYLSIVIPVYNEEKKEWEIIHKRVSFINFRNLKSDKDIESVGKCKETGQILASHTMKFEDNPDYTCLWLKEFTKPKKS